MNERCTVEEARLILGNTVDRPTAENVKRLQTLTDDDLTILSQSPDTFAINESSRRVSRRLMTLTWVVAVLTGILVVLTAALVWVEVWGGD